MTLRKQRRLALEDGFASQIEPGRYFHIDKDAFITAHHGRRRIYQRRHQVAHGPPATLCIPGAAALLSVIGSIFAGIYTKISRVAPEKASELATVPFSIVVGER